MTITKVHLGKYMLIGISLALLCGTTLALAGSGHSTSGFAWGGGVTANPSGYDGMGWISFNNLNCDTDTNGFVDIGDCGGNNDITTPSHDYGVYIPPTPGDVSGYAWSGGSNGADGMAGTADDGGYGWISFEDADMTGCIGLPPVRRTATGELVGGARILAIKEAINAGGNAGGYDGCIVFNPHVRVNATGDGLLGMAWSSDLGWIDMSGISLTPVSGPSLAVCPVNPTIDINETLQLTAYYRASGAPVTCGSVVGTDINVSDHDATAAPDYTTWTAAAPAVADVNNTGLVTSSATAGTSNITVTYDPDSTGTTVLTANTNVTVGCACNGAQAANVCSGTMYNDSCGNAVCAGTKTCILIPQ